MFSKICRCELVQAIPKFEIITKEEAPPKKATKLSDDPKCLLKIKKNEKFSRNEKCPATGKKYKNCCGAL